jgi:hypothetical protein
MQTTRISSSSSSNSNSNNNSSNSNSNSSSSNNKNNNNKPTKRRWSSNNSITFLYPSQPLSHPLSGHALRLGLETRSW